MSDLTSPTVNDGIDAPTNVLAVSGEFDPANPYTEVWMVDGSILRLPTSVLLASSAGNDARSGSALTSDQSLSIVVPIVEERLEVGKRTVATGLIRLQKTVQEYTKALDEVLAVRSFDIERRVLNQPVDAPPPIRQEGTTTVYSLVEEQLVLTKQLILKEEIRIVQRDTERRDTQVVTLHKEHLTVERDAVKPTL